MNASLVSGLNDPSGIVVTQDVPEPSSLVLLGAGAIGLLVWRRVARRAVKSTTFEQSKEDGPAMARIRKSICVALLGVMSVAVAHGADITYNLVNYPADQGGCSLSGSITTDGTIGPISASDVQSWSYTITDGNNSCSYQSGYNPGVAAGVVGTISCFNSVSATPTQILLTENDLTYPDGQGAAISLYLSESSIGLFAWDGYTGPGGPWYFYQNDMQNLGWSTLHPQMSGSNPWIIAHAQPTPEPSSLALFGAGAIGLLGYAWRRKRVARRAAKPTAFDQTEEDGPAIVSFPIHRAKAKRRAA